MNRDHRFCSIAEVVEMLGLSGRCETLYTSGYDTSCLRKIRMGKRHTVWVRAQVLRHVEVLTMKGECQGECKAALEESAQTPLYAVK